MTQMMVSSYRPPAILAKIAADSDRKPYMTYSRHFGLGGKWKPYKGIGGIYSFFPEKGDSHILRASWYTPQYTLSAMSFDPGREYIELARQSRLMGVTFSSDAFDKVLVLGTISGEERYLVTSSATNGLCVEDSMVVARDINVVSAEDLGKGATYSHLKGKDYKKDGMRIFISDGPLEDNLQQDDSGWFFTKTKDAFCGIRIASGGLSKHQSPLNMGLRLQLDDIWAPVVIETASAAEFKGDFEAFKRKIKSLPFSYDNGVMKRRTRKGDEIIYYSKSRKLPLINGKEIDLNPPYTYYGPYLKMKHGEKRAIINYPGEKTVVLDFD